MKVKIALSGGGRNQNLGNLESRTSSDELGLQWNGLGRTTGRSVERGEYTEEESSHSYSYGCIWVRPQRKGYQINFEIGGNEASSNFSLVTEYIDLDCNNVTFDRIVISFEAGQRGRGVVPMSLELWDGQSKNCEFSGPVRMWGRCDNAFSISSGVQESDGIFRDAARIMNEILSRAASERDGVPLEG